LEHFRATIQEQGSVILVWKTQILFASFYYSLFIMQIYT